MNLSELFETLLDKRKITLVITVAGAASLRVSLIRKLKDYKTQMESLGFLDPEIAECVISEEREKDSETSTFYLRPKKSRAVSYTLL